MIIECGSCQARYTIADALVPPQGARMRCKKCATVIAVKPAASAPAVPAPTVPAPTETTLVPASPEPAPQAAAPPRPPAPAAPPPAPEPAPVFTTSIFEMQPGFGAPEAAPVAPPAPVVQMPVAPAPPVAAPAPAPPAAAPAPQATPSTIPTGTPIPEGLSPEDRQKHERARRLARVLASDVAIYNREKRERGMQDGNIVAVLGYEIKKSWETYKERVGTDFANATPYFRDALNEIVAEGKKIF